MSSPTIQITPISIKRITVAVLPHT